MDKRWLVIGAGMLLVTSCSAGTPGASGEKPVVAVTILPQAEFVEAVAGDRFDVVVMVPPGADTHTYEPKPAQLAALSRAKAYIKMGSGIEFELAWMGKLVATNRQMPVIDSSAGIQLIPMSGEVAEGEKHQGAMDPHIWMSPRNARTIVQNISGGLVRVDPDNKATYERNRDAYLQKLSQLDRDIANSLSAATNRRFIMYHPSLGYFARDYNLTMIAIEEEGKEPKAANIARMIEAARKYNIKVIFTSPQFSPESGRVIASAIGGRVVSVDDLARDYIANQRRITNEMVAAMQSNQSGQ